MVLYLRDLGGLRQKLLKVAFPACRVVALAVAADSRPVEHRFDSAAHARGGFGLGLPDRLQHLEDVRQRDVAHQQFADVRVCVGLEGVRPLLPMLRVVPLVALRLDERLGALAEGLGRGVLGHQKRPRLLALLHRVDALHDLVAGTPSGITSTSEGYVRITAKTDVFPHRPDEHAQDPRLGAGRLYPQVQAGHAADRMAPWHLQPADLQRSKLDRLLRHP